MSSFHSSPCCHRHRSAAPSPPQTNRLTGQILAAVIQNRPLDSAPTQHNQTRIWTSVLRPIPLHLFQSPRSIGRQKTHRHRSPIHQRNLKQETTNRKTSSLILGPQRPQAPESRPREGARVLVLGREPVRLPAR
ncbi:pentatricopeptide repeat-containing protein [Striga asiatica]|uniref:Pentatricopeptide repeat-containing protein n=1 Tax=Striga asiatica TaxID=4170 RepID=A0A5A7PEJ8_STRAF|nr:pentatricopeptide repeat-containing protein [Striga asiatica]